MAGPALVLFDDRVAREWEPFALTRPAGELLFGAMRLVERAERALGLECIGHLTAPHLADFSEPGARAAISADSVPHDRPIVYWCARAAPAIGRRLVLPNPPAVLTMNGRPVGLVTAPGVRPPPGFLASLEPPPDTAAETPVTGRIVNAFWELMLGSPDQAAADLMEYAVAAPELPAGVHVIGRHPIQVHPSARLEPPILFDVREGPIRIAEGVEVRSGTRLGGPAVVGPHSRLLGGSLERIVTGPYSYLQGEVHHAVVLGYTNKAHHGYIGHAYLGRWVNLGAMTTNSDLKNNYHSVRIWTPAGERDTGELKVGCFLGDHVKTGIGLMLNTGTVVGAGANLYGSTMPPKYVPPFSWGEGAELTDYRLDAFLDTAARTMPRRGVELDARGRRHLESCWRRGREGR